MRLTLVKFWKWLAVKLSLENSYAGGIAIARPYRFEIDFMRNPISGSASWFFVIVLKFLFTPIFEIKIYTKKFLDTKNFIFEFPLSLTLAYI